MEGAAGVVVTMDFLGCFVRIDWPRRLIFSCSSWVDDLICAMVILVGFFSTVAATLPSTLTLDVVPMLFLVASGSLAGKQANVRLLFLTGGLAGVEFCDEVFEDCTACGSSSKIEFFSNSDFDSDGLSTVISGSVGATVSVTMSASFITTSSWNFGGAMGASLSKGGGAIFRTVLGVLAFSLTGDLKALIMFLYVYQRDAITENYWYDLHSISSKYLCHVFI